MKTITMFLLFFTLLAATRAEAQTGSAQPIPAPAAPAAAAPAPPAPAPPPAAYAPAPPPAYPPPGAYPPPPGAYGPPPAYGDAWGGNPYGNPYAISPQALFIYENEKKSPALALVLSLLVLPGVGSIYADHVMGFAITWGLILGGVGLIMYGVRNELDSNGQGFQDNQVDTTPIVLGYLMILGGYVYSPIDAWVSASDYNKALRQRLRLPEGLSIVPAPIRMGGVTAYGPALTFRF